MLYYGSSADGKVYALDALNGSLVWNYTTGDLVLSSPLVYDGLVYFGSQDKKIYALNSVDGSLVWNFTTSGPVYSSAAIANGIVYIGSRDHNIYALDAQTGDLIWNYPTGGFVDSSPAIAEGIVYVGSEDKKLYALAALSGNLVWSYTTEGMVVASPAVANGILYVGSYDHLVYAIGAYVPSPDVFQVSFVASDLPEGKSWNVNLNGETKFSSSTTITFRLPSGRYDFFVGSPFGYVASPEAGIVTVDSINVAEQIFFSSSVEDFSWLIVALFVVVLLVGTSLFILFRRRR